MGRTTRKTIIDFFAEMDEVINELSIEEAGMVYATCVKYCASGEVPEIDGNAKMVFLMLKREFDAEKSHIEEVSKNRSHKKPFVPNVPNEPIGTNEPNGTGEKESGPSPLSPSLSSPEPPSNTPPIVPQPTKEKESRTGEKVRQTIPPSVEQVRAYCIERKNGIDPEAFCDFYTARDWMSGKTKIKDWQAAVRTWEKKNGRKPSVPSQQTQDRKEAKLREYDEMTRRTFEALGFDYGSNG